ncbi:hypothetical protein DRE_01023 [Drechslerella stenobrocha 248]|uniref:Uncharacterized protein n=1 Tax=Drechslerella stenobrocha 248 TaxID=1043628 RepID=W7HPA2_9PEZI|nr:hypothetical protein DRE_01023 [Drechslerella stenobrocha 248]
MAADPEPSSKRIKLSASSSLNRAISPPPLSRPPSTPRIASDGPGKTLTISSPFKLTCIRDFPANKNIDCIGIKDILGNPLIRELWSFNYMHDLSWLVAQLDQDTARLTAVKIVHGSWRREDPARKQLEEQLALLTAPNSFTSGDGDTTGEEGGDGGRGGGYNIELITAYLPDAFGTHHSKMLVLFYADDTAQVVIHTANMIPFDWRNVTQAVWRSPVLPMLSADSDGRGTDTDKPTGTAASANSNTPTSTPTSTAASTATKAEKKEGVGYQFKEGLLAYLRVYQRRTDKLVGMLRLYDFRGVRAVFIGHAPGEHPINGPEGGLFGWSKLRRVLMRIGRGGGHGVSKAGKVVFPVKGHGEVVMQCSSVGTLGEAYFDDVLYPTFSTCRPNGGDNAFQALRTGGNAGRPSFALVFPTVENVRTSIDGWEGGSPIFMKGGKPAAVAQIQYLRSMLAVWGQPPIGIMSDVLVEAERGKATPHIKTYNMFSPPKASDGGDGDGSNHDDDDDDGDSDGEGFVRRAVPMDWAMITSANLSRQAWGGPAKGGASRVQSYEVGVLVHPGLYKDLLRDDEGSVQMAAVGGRDWLRDNDDSGDGGDGDGQEQVRADEVQEEMDGKWRTVKVAIRLAYDYPLRRYSAGDEPWCRDEAYGNARDRRGMRWPPRFEDILRAHLAANSDEVEE